MESIKITALEIENTKRIKAVRLRPSQNGLTVIGGNNKQGKTSVLDAIAWALGGDRYRPDAATRDGSVIPPRLHVKLSNGLVVERTGKNSALKVIDPKGNKAGQQLLNEFISTLALDLPKFMQATDKEKGETLLQIIGVGAELARLEQEEAEAYNERLLVGRIADQKAKYAKEMPEIDPTVPSEPISASELIRQQQEILARNGENQRKRDRLREISERVVSIQSQIAMLEAELAQAEGDLDMAQLSCKDLEDRSTAELEANIAQIEELNVRIRANLDREKAEEDAKDYQHQYAVLTEKLSAVRQKKAALLEGANLPLPGLGVEDGALTYQGRRWGDMSGSEQLVVATAIVRKLNPKCGFVLLDKLEQMDIGTLAHFGKWLEDEGLQAISTRVSTGSECSIIIEDGYVQGEPITQTPEPKWKEGEF